MISDIDELMRIYNVEALLVTGPARHNPAMVYMTGGANLSEADLIKKRGEKAVLFCNNMEREEALKTGLDIKGYDRYGMKNLLKKAGNDYIKAIVLRYEMMLQELGIKSGNIALYGQIDIGYCYEVFTTLKKVIPGLSFISSQEDDILSQAMMTKDAIEIERISHMGEITLRVVERVSDYLSRQRIVKGNLVNADGEFVRIEDIKRRIDLWLAEMGAENPHGTIFAIGSDTSVPHNKGTANDIISTGKPIIFDIYPCESGGGYFFDFTRTWCLEYALDEVYSLYDQVYKVYTQVIDQLIPNEIFSRYQNTTCDLFEDMGHTTIRSDPATKDGYNHSLGHGVGLNVHERPFSGIKATERDILALGSVFTIEPGVYYPDRGIGVRLENTLYVSPSGDIRTLGDFPMDLVLSVGKNG
jgi:Xaa-Pro aminopeptidase